jgi:flagellar biosynthesis protein FlhF
MIIKKFQANSETEAIMLAKNELGKDAIVMNIKTISPKGIFRLFRKSTVEVTAAVDEPQNYGDKSSIGEKANYGSNAAFSRAIAKQESDIAALTKDKNDSRAIEEKLNSLQSMLEEQLSKNTRLEDKESDVKKEVRKEEVLSKSIACVRLIYNQLIANEVDEQFANQIVGEIEPTIKKDASIDVILASFYQKIILKLGQTKTLEISEGKAKFVFFIGPTGVGKTTTIAKLASSLKVCKKGKVALLTSDTYRIAAVEQLRTYANILDVPIRVIYSESEMEEARQDFQSYDIVLVDTAGRSHKNREQRDNIEKLIHSIPEEERETYLVLSATTKYKDLIKITQNYSDITNYRLIFTKLDETSSIGNIYNIKMLTNASLSYATFGQNVPDDIDKVDAQNIARQLLGGNE